jgi:cysteine desulfurase family protein (TIGR01976 family)
MSFPIELVRNRFPALAVTDDGKDRVYFDAPGGTQACLQSIERMSHHLATGTANSGGAFATSVSTDALSQEAHKAMADLLGGTPGEIAFGPNMTSLTLAVSRALARDWQHGDELIVTRLDHDANVAPWLSVAEDKGMTVRWLDFDQKTGRLNLESLAELLSPRTRLVAVGGASNALGTLNDVQTIVGLVRDGSDALIYVDAVQLAPHVPIDVRAMGCDLLVCSPYKLFGPHAGVLWCKEELIETVAAYKVRPASNCGASRFETGTPSFEAQAGVLGMVEYLDWLGGIVSTQTNRRQRILAAFKACVAYELTLGERFLAGLARMNSATLFGPSTMEGRVPTFAFTLKGHSPQEVERHLAEKGIFSWSGSFYAVETVASLGLADQGGLVRVGMCHYNTAEEVDLLLAALGEITNAQTCSLSRS